MLAPPDPATLRGAVGIANVTLGTVLERTGEFGLRRALGAGRRHIAAQFLVEFTTIGLIGGVVEASHGSTTVVVVAVLRYWTPCSTPRCAPPDCNRRRPPRGT